MIESQLQLPAIDLSQVQNNFTEFEWRTVKTSGLFNADKQILLKNRYFEGVYGYEVLTRFTTTDSRSFWVDRGWLVAGKDALTAPQVPFTPPGNVEIVGRLRLDSSLPSGSFFALPQSGDGLISKWNAQNEVATEPFYVDLLNGSWLSSVEVPAQLPELSDGPHMAYALQWLFFAGLVGYGRVLIRRSR
jgi:cytochrome oxidase assembly protein ShyY1